MKALFIPLKTEYFNDFLHGRKTEEYRLEGKRWNDKTCKTGRPVILSKGYGKYHRIEGVIMDTYTIENCTQPDFVKLYGENRTARVIVPKLRKAGK